MAVCDHTSVGMLVQKDGKTLLIERMKKPFGFALPAGHVDGDSTYEKAAARELYEEVGLTADSLELVAEGRKENPCSREGGSWHYWKIYRVSFSGELHRSVEETKKAGWYTADALQMLSQRTRLYQKGDISEEKWQQEPGLEPVMYDWCKELGLL